MRYSHDHGENEYGLELLEFCKTCTGFITMNGYIHDDKHIGLSF